MGDVETQISNIAPPIAGNRGAATNGQADGKKSGRPVPYPTTPSVPLVESDSNARAVARSA
jgi:hypothetical protein